MTAPVRRTFPAMSFAELRSATDWMPARPFCAHVLNAYTLMAPAGEQFIIRACARYADVVDGPLRDDLNSMLFQEAMHRRVHKEAAKALMDAGINAPTYFRVAQWVFYRALEPATPKLLRLASAAAIEHLNAVLGKHFLSRALLDDVCLSSVRSLFLWHFCEEIEHEETSLSLLTVVTPRMSLRRIGLLLGFPTFIPYLLIGAVILALKSGTVYRASFWQDFGRECLSRKGLVWAFLKEARGFWTRNYISVNRRLPELLSAAVVDLERSSIVPVDPKPRGPASVPIKPGAIVK